MSIIIRWEGEEEEEKEAVGEKEKNRRQKRGAKWRRRGGREEDRAQGTDCGEIESYKYTPN